MILKVVCSAAAVLAISQPAQAAQPAPEMAEIQQQLNALRSEYDARISELEARLKAAEAREGAALPTAPAEVAPAPAVEAGIAPGEVVIADVTPEPVAPANMANASNPGVSVVLNGNYVATSHDPTGARIPGFQVSDDAGLYPRGFSLGESEITLAANVDPYLTANLTASFGRENNVSVEEAFIQTTALPGGLTLKGGRFFSGVGYLNERHAHNWSFIDMPLPYRAFLGNQYGDDGVQVRWLAPTPFFLELGGELYRGDSFPAANGADNNPGTQTLYAHFGSDITASSSFLGAISFMHANAQDRTIGADTFNGKDDLGIASLVYKWAPGGNLGDRNLTLSGEYFAGRQDGAFNDVGVTRDQRGWYVQGAYQFNRRWSAGLRYASLSADGVPLSLAGSTLDPLGRTPSAVSGLVEYDSSEFGRFRLQFSRDMAEERANDLLMLQYTVVYGPHGAHRY